MKESNWNECIECNSAAKISPDSKKAKSLIQVAGGRTLYLESNRLDEANANYIFEGLYASISELIHSIAFSEGYKIFNHICLGFFLRDFLKKEALFRMFDDCRYKRNSLVYYGKKMDFESAKDSIEKAKRLIKGLKNIANEK